MEVIAHGTDMELEDFLRDLYSKCPRSSKNDCPEILFNLVPVPPTPPYWCSDKTFVAAGLHLPHTSRNVYVRLKHQLRVGVWTDDEVALRTTWTKETLWRIVVTLVKKQQWVDLQADERQLTAIPEHLEAALDLAASELNMMQAHVRAELGGGQSGSRP
jgi:hypothetical protein